MNVAPQRAEDRVNQLLNRQAVPANPALEALSGDDLTSQIAAKRAEIAAKKAADLEAQ